jgi:cbb3-type cytochrome oxidase subunit 3
MIGFGAFLILLYAMVAYSCRKPQRRETAQAEEPLLEADEDFY